MHAEIIAIGTELTTGAKLDTNSQWLSIELAAVGIPVRYHTTVADSLEANLLVFQNAIDRADIVLISGGLGPTLDDLTREVLAKLLGVELVLHETSLQQIKEMFSRRNRPMPERNVIQAMFPAGSSPIPNPRGTAPGVWIEIPRTDRTACRIAAMPGVPSEMKPMFRDSVLPKLSDLCGSGTVIRSARVNCFGLGESHAEELLGDLTKRGRDPEVGITVHEGTITLRIEATGATGAECDAKIASTKTLARERLGEYIFGEVDEQLEHIVIRQLRRQGQTLRTAESSTGGLLAMSLTNVEGFEAVYLGGQIGCEERLTEIHRPPPGTDFMLIIGDTVDTITDPALPPIPKIRVTLRGPGVSQSSEVQGLSDPTILKSRAAKTALDLLRRHLGN
jgi:nicotinamide-nucleotide amidase